MKKVILIALGIFASQISFGQECLNVKFKLRGYFYAGTSQVDSTALGGFYEDKNSPKNLTSEISEYSKSNKLEIIVKPELTAEFEKGILGFKVFIINKSDSISELPAQDSRLYLKRQVFYKNEWRDIEYLPSSWCGNSYHSVYIKPNEYWDFSAPCVKGKIKTKFRFELYINEKLTIYSNEFEGSFNKRQLKKEQGHKPIGIMNPYNN
ncbi:hypothetical protein KO506_12920 [Polaribacter vadi]|uniref:hypothetical protein n=1 Tax=Polaribacter TaxID=52959 RepID=UPI001C09CBC4|nr:MULTISPECIES: hypothetical protein [Polaribacter]MBU3012311.1 hypothetical protein [Polaribacter vadi]MDO6742128.1 hypothetical protein [Polaribacter sp. 1_MG-2023]